MEKEYKLGGFRFKVKVNESGVITLLRLPVLPDNIDTGMESQDVTVHHKDTFDPAAIGWGDMPKEEALESCRENSEFESKRYIVGEYVGRESSSSNLAPDKALDGFLDNEIWVALETLDRDEELERFMVEKLFEKTVLK